MLKNKREVLKMKGIRKLHNLILILCMVLCFTACAGKSKVDSAVMTDTEQTASTAPVQGQSEKTEPKTMNMAVSFFYPSLEVHKDYYGWSTSIYGM